MTDVTSLPHAAPGARVVTPDDVAAPGIVESLTGPPVEGVLFSVPESGHLRLPTGLLEGAEHINTAEVKELTGAEEEMLAKESRNQAVTTPAHFLDSILKAAVVGLGGEKPDVTKLRRLTVGDRNYLGLAIRRLTYGDEWEVADFICRLCGKTIGVAFDLRCPGDDIKLKTLSDPKDQCVDVNLRHGRARLRLVNGGDELASIGDGTLTVPEQTTIIIDSCVLEVDGQHPPVNFARSLGLKDRRTIMEKLGEVAPGPRLGEVSVPCSECGGSASYALNMADLFLR